MRGSRVVRSSRLFGLFACAIGTVWAGQAHAFKPGTHVAAAVETGTQLGARITADSVTNTLVFEVNGRRLDLNINAKEAYLAVLAHPEFYRAGVVGPDGFPDPLTGQFMAHGNETPILKDLIEAMDMPRPIDHAIFEAFESRQGPAELRSIDFATALLEFFRTSYVPTGTPDQIVRERQQILAFIIGYYSHGIGDGFAHTWVNEIAGGAWSFSNGGGLWGPFSEEVKHVAVETFVDSLVPPNLVSVPGDGGGHGLVVLRAPVAFLDAFYAARLRHAPPSTVNPLGDFDSYLGFYGNFNNFHGGIFYNYMNAQVAVAPALRNWSRLGGLFNLAEDVANDWWINFGLDVADLPFEVLSWIGPPEAWVDELTLGYVDCHVDHGGPTAIDQLQEAIEFVGGINGRVSKHSTKAEIVRRNWVRMSECSSQNLAKTAAADFDPAVPTFNTDACADVVRAGWVDEGNEAGLYRGSIRPGLPSDDEFLLDLKAAFLGGDAGELFLNIDDPTAGNAPWNVEAAIEENNGHRSLRTNLQRELDYLFDFAFRVDELSEVILPEDDEPSLGDTYRQFCSTVRDQAFENCLDIAFAPIAAAGRAVVCAAEHAQCTADAVADCLASACQAACPFSNSQCSDLCGGGSPNACESTCDDLFCVDIFGAEVCEPITHTVCTGICSLFSSETDNCAEAALDEAVCGVEHIVCDVENFIDTITLENYAEELLAPGRFACDTIDDALAFFQCLRGDPAKTKEEQAADRRVCVIDRCVQAGVSAAECTSAYDGIEDAYREAEAIRDAVSRAADALRDRPAHEFVNLAFLLEDLQEDPTYLLQLRDAVQDTQNDLNSNPPGPGATPDEIARYNARQAALARWAQLIDDVENLGTSTTPLADFRNAAAEAADLIADSAALGLIPTAIGPTARRILDEIGPSFRNTFLPFFNTVQGMKLAPLTSRVDLEGLMGDVGADRLPWNSGLHSPACSVDEQVNPYCDVIASFDDPNCLDCDDSLLTPDPTRLSWVNGRGLVAWNDYDPTVTVQHVTTNFAVASSDPAYDEIYTRIFQVPSAVPGWAGFGDEDDPWTSQQAPLTPNTTNSTEGGSSLQIDGCGWIQLDSPRFRTADWGTIGSEILFDLFIPAQQSNPHWVGDVQFFVTIPGAGINNQWLGWQSLTDLPRGAWSEIGFDVPANVQNALLGDFANAQFNIALNIGSCLERVLIDNLRFGGELRERTTFHLRGSQVNDVRTNPLFSFDDESDWSSDAAISSSDERVEGTAALGVAAAGWTPVVSREFSTAELIDVTNQLSIDIHIPEPQPNIYWYGDVQLYFTCGPFQNAWIGMQPLTNLFAGEFNTLSFTLSDDLTSLLRGEQGVVDQCTVTVALNVNPSGTFILDNMGFH